MISFLTWVVCFGSLLNWSYATKFILSLIQVWSMASWKAHWARRQVVLLGPGFPWATPDTPHFPCGSSPHADQFRALLPNSGQGACCSKCSVDSPGDLSEWMSEASEHGKVERGWGDAGSASWCDFNINEEIPGQMRDRGWLDLCLLSRISPFPAWDSAPWRTSAYSRRGAEREMSLSVWLLLTYFFTGNKSLTFFNRCHFLG